MAGPLGLRASGLLSTGGAPSYALIPCSLNTPQHVSQRWRHSSSFIEPVEGHCYWRLTPQQHVQWRELCSEKNTHVRPLLTRGKPTVNEHNNQTDDVYSLSTPTHQLFWWFLMYNKHMSWWKLKPKLFVLTDDSHLAIAVQRQIQNSVGSYVKAIMSDPQLHRIYCAYVNFSHVISLITNTSLMTINKTKHREHSAKMITSGRTHNRMDEYTCSTVRYSSSHSQSHHQTFQYWLILYQPCFDFEILTTFWMKVKGWMVELWILVFSCVAYFYLQL